LIILNESSIGTRYQIYVFLYHLIASHCPEKKNAWTDPSISRGFHAGASCTGNTGKNDSLFTKKTQAVVFGANFPRFLHRLPKVDLWRSGLVMISSPQWITGPLDSLGRATEYGEKRGYYGTFMEIHGDICWGCITNYNPKLNS
jgi:hypothetical protein